MTISTALKAGALVVFGFFASLITFANMADTKQAQKNSEVSATSKRLAPGAAPKRRVANPRQLEVSAFKLESMNVTAIGRNVKVVASAAITEMRSGRTYLWTLTATDVNTGKRVANHLYKNQRFSVKVGQTATPTFTETFPVAPGTYKVELRLVDVHSSVDITALTNDSIKISNLILSGLEEVTVN